MSASPRSASPRRGAGRSLWRLGLGLALVGGALGCDGTSEAPSALSVSAPGASAPSRPAGWSESDTRQLARLRLTEALPDSPTNRWADDPEAAALGRGLFYDAGLSPKGFSCAACHDPAQHFTDGRVRSQAAGTTGRHAPTIEGAQQGPWFFWDGRADSLWAQAIGPLEHPHEMASDRMYVARHVADRWREPYEALFGPLPDLSDPTLPAHARPAAPDAPAEQVAAWEALDEARQQEVTEVLVHVAKAIAAFERTVLPGEAPFDRYVDAVLDGDPTGGGHLSDEAVAGLRIFLGRGQCVSCHHGPMFTDRAFHNLGLPEASGVDVGRMAGAVQVQRSEFNCEGPWSDTGDCPELRFLNPTFDDFPAAFKTPTLRNVAETAPYMHHGELPDLPAVLAFYSELPTEPLMGHRELTLQPLHLSQDEADHLVAFLEALTAPVRPEALPPQAEASAMAE